MSENSTSAVHGGRKIPVNASNESLHREPALQRYRREAEEHLAQWHALRAQASTRSKAQDAAQLRALEEKLARLDAAIAKVKDRRENDTRMQSKDAQPEEVRASETDPDARKMKVSNGGHTPA